MPPHKIRQEWLNWAGVSSPVWFLGSHCFDLVLYLSRQKVVSVYGTGQEQRLVAQDINT